MNVRLLAVSFLFGMSTIHFLSSVELFSLKGSTIMIGLSIGFYLIMKYVFKLKMHKN